MNNQQIRNITVDELKEFIDNDQITIDDLFKVINIAEDQDACLFARHSVYKKLSILFLKNYLLDDYFDKYKNESLTIYQYISEFISDHDEIKKILIDAVEKISESIRIHTIWNILYTCTLSIDDLHVIVCAVKDDIVRRKAWNKYLTEIRVGNDDNMKRHQIRNTFLECNDAEIEYDCWNMMNEMKIFGDSSLLDIVLETNHFKICEYAWRRLDSATLPTDILLDVAANAKSEKVAEEALKLCRKKTNID